MLGVEFLGRRSRLFHHVPLYLFALFASITTARILVSFVAVLAGARKGRDELGWLSLVLRLEAPRPGLVRIMLQRCHIGLEPIVVVVDHATVLAGGPDPFAGSQAHCLLRSVHPV